MNPLRSVREQPLLYLGVFISLLVGSTLMALTALCLAADAKYAEVTGQESDFGSLMGYVAIISGFMTISVVMTSCSFMVRLRRRELGLLRMLGASPSRIVRGELTRMLVPALLAAVLGSLIAIAVAPLMFAAAKWSGFTEATLQMPGVWPAFIAAAAVCGAAAALGGYLPARRAARTSPLAALQAADTNTQTRSTGRLFLGTCSGAGGLVLIAFVRPDSPLLAMMVGVFAPPMLASAVVAWSPWILPRLASVLLRPLANHDPVAYAAMCGTRTSRPAVAALAAPAIAMIAIAGGFALTIDTSQQFVERVVDRDLMATAVVDGPIEPEAATGLMVDSPLLTQITMLGGDDDRDVEAMGIDPATYAQTWRNASTSGDLAELGPGTVAMGEFEAWDRGLDLGSVLKVRLADGTAQQLRVVALMNEDAGVAPTVMISRDVVAEHDPDASVENSFVIGADAATIPGAVSAQQWIDDVTGESRSENNVALVVLLFPPCLYGLLSMVNTVMMRTSVRDSEFRLGHRLGFDRDQLIALVRYEVAATVGAAVIAGGGIGVGMGLFIRQMILHDGLMVLLRPPLFAVLALIVAGWALAMAAATVAVRSKTRAL